MTARARHVVVQMTQFCNINCSYCYLADRHDTTRVTVATVRKLAERLEAHQDTSTPLSWYWHVGEPLAVGLEHFRACHSAVEAGAPILARHMDFHVQTNGTLVNEEWASFFAKHNYEVGVSIDGPKDIHDAHRVTRANGGTYDKVVNGIRLLREAGVRVGALVVVTAASIERPVDLLREVARLGFDNVGFNFEESEGANAASSLRSLELSGQLRPKI